MKHSVLLLLATVLFSLLPIVYAQPQAYVNPFDSDPANNAVPDGTRLISYENYIAGSWIVYGKGMRKYLNSNIVLSCTNNQFVNEYSFNAQNQTTEFRQNTFSGPFYRWLYTYFPNGRVATAIQQFWDTETAHDYINVYKTVRTLDAHDFILRDSLYAWSHTAWEPYSKTEYTTNNKGHILTQTTYNYGNGQWTNFNRSTFIRDTAGNPLSKINEFWNSSTWIMSTLDSGIFSNNLLVEMITKKYNTNSWVNYNRKILTYDGNGENVQVVYDSWKTNLWSTTSRDVFTKKPDRNIILHHPHSGTYYSSDVIVVGWTSNGVSAVNVSLSTNNGASWNQLSGNLANSHVGFYAYKNATINSDQCLFKVTDALDGTVTDQSVAPFSLRPSPAFLMHETGAVQLAVYNTGKIGGGDNDQIGGGFTFRGKKNPLFRAGALLGLTSLSASGLFGFLVPIGINNFVQTVPLAGFTSNANFNQISDATFALPNITAPLNQLSIQQRSYSNAGADHVFFVYSVTNVSNTAVNGFHMGFNADWDIGTATENLGGVEAENSLVYQFNQNGLADSNYYGIVALNSFSGGKVTTSSNTWNVEGWTWITTIAPETITGPGDYRSFIGSGPFTIPAQGHIQAGFALVGGSSLHELKTKAGTLKQLWQNGILYTERTSFSTVGTFTLSQNFPNPFNPSTTIRYAIPAASHVRLSIHDLLGREVAVLLNEEQSAGWNEVEWNAEQYANGIYFYRLTAGSFTETRKMLLLK